MLSEIEKYIIQRVKTIRIENKISQADLAYKIGVSTGFIGKVESLKYNSKYNLNHINSISRALKISPRDLMPEKSL